MKLKTGDKVVVLAGKDKGKSGKIARAFPRLGRVVVEGINISKKHRRPRREREKGQTVEVAMPVAISNVQFFCDRCKRGVRLGAQVDAKKNKTRVCRRCGAGV